MQNRLKSPVLWLSVSALITFILKTYFNIEIPEFDTLVDMIITVAILFGIVNNPTDKERF